MKTTFKFCLLLVSSFFVLSFNSIDKLKVEIINSNVELKTNHIELENGLYLINKKDYESLYVKVKSKRVNGKRNNGNDFQKVKVKGIKYTLNFIEKLNNKETVLRKEKVFVTVWNNGEIDTWKTKPKVQIGNYQFQIIADK